VEKFSEKVSFISSVADLLRGDSNLEIQRYIHQRWGDGTE